tara:strand:- start:41 stop:928 length:888 start_codon:yes stop_codon:yes gene_type:complete
MLLITTEHKTQSSFILFDEEKCKIKKVVPYEKDLDSHLENQNRPTFRPFGIAYDGDFIYVASNDRICSFDKKTFEYKKLITSSGRINTHHILYHNNFIYRCDTAVNCITRIDLKTLEEIHYDCLFREKISPLTKTIDAKQIDVLHINSISIYKDKLYVVAHCLGRRSSPSYSFTLDLDLNNYENHIDNLGFSVHDIIVLNNESYVLDTSSGNLVKFDSKKNKKKYNIVNSNKWFLRGMTKKNKYLYIFAGPNHKTTKNLTKSKLIIFNLETKTFDKKYIDNINIIHQVKNYGENE